MRQFVEQQQNNHLVGGDLWVRDKDDDRSNAREDNGFVHWECIWVWCTKSGDRPLNVGGAMWACDHCAGACRNRWSYRRLFAARRPMDQCWHREEVEEGLPQRAEQNWAGRRTAMSLNWEPWQRNRLNERRAVHSRDHLDVALTYRYPRVFCCHSRPDIVRSDSCSHQYLGTCAVTSMYIRNRTLAEKRSTVWTETCRLSTYLQLRNHRFFVVVRSTQLTD